ncbi:MAG: DNA repair protein RecO [Bdellovibrionales bacterium]|nr:DNA repair protein RecO [Bdellovibrionales bacterium]
MQVRDRIIVLRKTKYGESDLIVHGLSPKVGQIGFIAKGALRSKRRFGGGVLEPTHFVEITYKGDGGYMADRLHLMYEASLIKDFHALREDYERLELSLYFLQVVGKIQQGEGAEAKELFDLLGNALQAATTSPSLAVLRAHFEAKVLYQQGVWPQDLASQPWLELGLAEHTKIAVSSVETKSFQRQVHTSLESYLHR